MILEKLACSQETAHAQLWEILPKVKYNDFYEIFPSLILPLLTSNEITVTFQYGQPNQNKQTNKQEVVLLIRKDRVEICTQQFL